MLKHAVLALIIAGLAAEAHAQNGARGRNMRGSQGGAAARQDRAQDIARERSLNKAKMESNLADRRERFDTAIANGEAEVKAIKDQAAAEMRELTPGEQRRIGAIETRIANAKDNKEKAFATAEAAAQQVGEERADRRARNDGIEADRRRAAGLRATPDPVISRPNRD